MNTIEVHPHICSLCTDQYPCARPSCGILDKYAVCNNPACVEEWTRLSEAEEEEPHSQLCICEDHS